MRVDEKFLLNVMKAVKNVSNKNETRIKIKTKNMIFMIQNFFLSNPKKEKNIFPS